MIVNTQDMSVQCMKDWIQRIDFIVRGIESDLMCPRRYVEGIKSVPMTRPQGAAHKVTGCQLQGKPTVESDPVAQAIRSYGRWFLRMARDSEDTLQDAAVKVIEHGASTKQEAVRLLACAIKRLQIDDARKQQKAAARLADIALIAGQHHDPRERAVRDAVRKLSRTDRELVEAVYWQGFSITEYASTIGQTRAAVSMRLSRVRERIAQMF